jgi:hypothetical protein
LKQQKSFIATLEKVNNLCQPIGEHTTTVGAQSPTKIIHSLKVENDDLKKKVKQTTQKYWNARRWNLMLEKAATGCKIDLKQAKIDAAHVCRVMNMLGKDLEDLRMTVIILLLLCDWMNGLYLCVIYLFLLIRQTVTIVASWLYTHQEQNRLLSVADYWMIVVTMVVYKIV